MQLPLGLFGALWVRRTIGCPMKHDGPAGCSTLASSPALPHSDGILFSPGDHMHPRFGRLNRLRLLRPFPSSSVPVPVLWRTLTGWPFRIENDHAGPNAGQVRTQSQPKPWAPGNRCRVGRPRAHIK